MYLLPILFVLFVIPLIVRLKVIALEPSIYLLWNGKEVNTDFFSYYKGMMLIVAAISAVLIYFFDCSRERLISIKKNRSWYFLIGALSFLVLLSFFFSNYGRLSLYGAPDRYEGIYIWIAYFIFLFFASEYIFDDRSHYWIIASVFLFTLLIGILGFFQYIEKDLFNMDFFRRLIIPDAYKQYLTSFYLAGDSVHNLYGTSYHYNYMGSLAPMLLAFSSVLMFFHPREWVRRISVAAVLMSLFLTVGSTARSGFVAVCIFFVFMLSFFANRVFGNPKRRRIFFGAILLAVFVTALGPGKVMLYRLPSLAEDLQQIFRSGGEDYRAQIPLKNVSIEGEKIRIEIEDKTLVIEARQERLMDGEGNEISYQEEQKDLWKLSAPYENYRIAFVRDEKTNRRYIKVDDTKGIELFFVDTGEKIEATNPKGLIIPLEEAPSFGFAGKERLGSSRGYIWSRTLPLLSSRLLLGYGPDSFLAVFPQGDIYAKLYAYDSIWTVVDKPHSLYLQMVINAGWLFLLIFVLMVGKLLWSFYRRYHPKDVEIKEKDALGLACFMAVIAYLGAGFFNDSVLSVAPIFWVFFGLAIAVIKDR